MPRPHSAPLLWSLAERFGWHAPFFVLAAAGAGVFAYAARVLPAMPAHAAHSAHGAWSRMAAILSDEMGWANGTTFDISGGQLL